MSSAIPIAILKTPPVKWAFRTVDKFRDYTNGCSYEGCRGARNDEALPYCPLHQAAIDSGEYIMALPEMALYNYYLKQFKQAHRFTAYITPVGAPRQLRSDAWKLRDCVIEYRHFKEEMKKACGPITFDVQHVWCQCYLPMPAKTWSKKKLDRMDDTAHQQKPDFDNIQKAIADSLFKNDGIISGASIFKRWCKEGEQRLEVGLFG